MLCDKIIIIERDHKTWRAYVGVDEEALLEKEVIKTSNRRHAKTYCRIDQFVDEGKEYERSCGK
jgi:hypothetical protein